MDLVFAQIYGPSLKPTSHKSEQKKWGFVTYSMEWGKEVIKICIKYLSSNRERIIIIQFKQTFEFSRPHSEIHPAKLTNHGVLTNWVWNTQTQKVLISKVSLENLHCLW